MTAESHQWDIVTVRINPEDRDERADQSRESQHDARLFGPGVVEMREVQRERREEIRVREDIKKRAQHQAAQHWVFEHRRQLPNVRRRLLLMRFR